MNSVETAPPTFWVGRVGRAQLGEALLEVLQLAHPGVEVGVGERRVVEHVVAPAGVLDLLDELLVAVARLAARRRGRSLGRGHGHILPDPSDSARHRRRPVETTDARPGRPEPDRARHAVPPTGLVLMLHGGKERGRTAVDGRSASWRRSAAMADALAGGFADAGAATWLLRYRHRGWNGGAGPVADARWALAQARDGTPACRSCCSATRWAPAPRSTSPTTPRCGASSRWRRGCPRASRSPPWPAGGCSPPTAAATTSPPPGDPRLRRPRPGGRRRRVVRRHGPGRPLHAAPGGRLERDRPGRLADPARRLTPPTSRLRNETVSFYRMKRNRFVPSAGSPPWCPTPPPPGRGSRATASRRSSTPR